MNSGSKIAISLVLISKVSPLTTAETSLLVAKDAISDQLLSFCRAAQLLYFPDLSSCPLAYGDDEGDTTLAGGTNVNRGVEPGKFFEESMLRSGNVIWMPDLRVKTPKRSFLPHSISSGLLFSTSKLAKLKQIVHAGDNSNIEKVTLRTHCWCERVPIQGETKQCVSSVEGVINFATSILGHDIKLQSMENVRGSKREILIGQVKRMDESKSSPPMACHETLFPHTVYYYHAFPTLRVYKVDILNPVSKAKINHGITLCHMDTLAWSPNYETFLALGLGPSRIEACHRVYGDYAVWTRANY